jgi:MFS family permease
VNTSPPPPDGSGGACAPADPRKAGPLSYTGAGLFLLFVWLLWGEFCFAIMEELVPNILPVLLKDHGASNKEITIIVTTLASMLNTIGVPIISYRSDRTRSRFGRRIPYLIWTTPLLVCFLAALPFAPELAKLMLKVGWVASVFAHSPVTSVVFVFGVLTACFQAFNLVATSMYNYLFVDVVPPQYLGRFCAMFRVFGYGAVFVFNFFIFGMAKTHTREIFVGLALLYGFSFALMCWRVKEGEYPPVQDEVKSSWFGGVRNYFVQCFSKPFYLWMYLAYALYIWSRASFIFWIFFFRDQLGMDLDTIGKYRSWAFLMVIPLAYPYGLMVDRWKGQRVLMLGTGLFAAANMICFYNISGKWSLLVCMLIWVSAILLIGVSNIAWMREMFPQSQYGQFVSALSVTAGVSAIIVNPLCGLLFDHIQNYRYVFVWTTVLLILSLLVLIKVRSNWIRHGGPDSYQAP